MHRHCKFFSWWVSHPLVVSRDHLKDLKYPLNSLRSKHRHSRELFRILMMAWLVELWGRNERQDSGPRFILFFTTGSHVWKLYTSEPVLGFQYLEFILQLNSWNYPARCLFETFIQSFNTGSFIDELKFKFRKASCVRPVYVQICIFLLLLFSYWVVSNAFSTPWTIARQAPLSVKFHKWEYWSGLPFSSSGDLPDPAMGLASPALAGGFFTNEPQGSPVFVF